MKLMRGHQPDVPDAGQLRVSFRENLLKKADSRMAIRLGKRRRSNPFDLIPGKPGDGSW